MHKSLKKKKEKNLSHILELRQHLNASNSKNNSYLNSFLYLEAAVLNNMLLPKGNITCPKAYMKKGKVLILARRYRRSLQDSVTVVIRG